MKRYLFALLLALFMALGPQVQAATKVQLMLTTHSFSDIEPYGGTLEVAPADPVLWRQFGTYTIPVIFGGENDPITNTWVSVGAAVNYKWNDIRTHYENLFNAAYPGVYEMQNTFVDVSYQEFKLFNGLAANALMRGSPATVTRSLTTSTGAAGFQISTYRPTYACYSIATSTTATIGGASTATAFLEVAPTNSATAGDWVERARVSNSQTITLAVALQSVQGFTNELCTYVPAGYYVKLRYTTSGTASVTFVSGKETPY